MKNVERIVEMLKGKELNALLQVTDKDSRRAKPWAPISRHKRVSFKLVIKMFVQMPFDVGLRGWWERDEHLKGWGSLLSSLPYLQGWVRTWINARESLSDPQLKPRRQSEEKIPFSECLYVPGAVLSTLLNRTKIAEVTWYYSMVIKQSGSRISLLSAPALPLTTGVFSDLSHPGYKVGMILMQSKATMRNHLTPVKMPSSKSLQIINVGESEEKRILLHYGWECELVQLLWKTV